MMHRLILATLCTLSAWPALAQGNCTTRTALTVALATSYSEAPVIMGITSTGAVLELWANAETGSWTVLTVTPDGVACIRATGDNFMPLPGGEPA
jgi:hypothetical protein